ncbi:hypothetical protein [Paenibacillus sp. B01]|uniref:hypothetical protein n=1 Tax=Paenibacillus sp. B01 TaxID=2660554 RepID=UPI00129C0A24|nr:hypothetical protein [Paenibacillus sp. B01]QGG54960.1 hypothetical protein GE073_04740 [Paenibacillus sp. B01]
MYSRLKKKLQELLRGKAPGGLLACRLAALPAVLAVAAAGALAAPGTAQAAPFRLDQDVVPEQSQASASELVRHADGIAVGSFGESDRMVQTGQSAPQGRLVNFVQKFTVKRWIKGGGSNELTVVTTGIEPLPPPSQLEANERYPGAWATGPDYLLFLHKLEGTDSYVPLGLLQGVYPIQGGRTVSLEDKGFPQLNGIAEAGVQQAVDRLAGS